MLTAAADSLDRSPPSVVVSPERRDALMLLDAVFSDPYARERKAVQDFHLARAQRVIEELEKTRITDGSARIWSFYNMGFIARTRSVTIGFDLISARHLPSFTLPDELMSRLISQCDVLFISHTHWDHADPVLSQAFIEAGKPVVGPPDLWKEYSINSELTKFARNSGTSQTLKLRGGACKLLVTVYPGFQQVKGGTDVTNNVYQIQTPEGICIDHTGDNNGYQPEKFDWIDDAHLHGKVDILFLNDFSRIIPRTLRGINPRLVIDGHFEELGHEDVWARVPYWRGLTHGEKSKWPWLIMGWGEHFDYRSGDFADATVATPFTK